MLLMWQRIYHMYHMNREIKKCIRSFRQEVHCWEDLLGVCGKPVSGICERGIEAGVFETGMVLVNHRSTPYEIGNLKGNRKFTNPVNDTVLLPHSAVWIERE